MSDEPTLLDRVFEILDAGPADRPDVDVVLVVLDQGVGLYAPLSLSKRRALALIDYLSAATDAFVEDDKAGKLRDVLSPPH